LKLDYQDFLRQRGMRQWDENDPRRAELIARRPVTADDVAAWVKEIHDKEQRGLRGQDRLDGRSNAKPPPSISSTPSTKSNYSGPSANAILVLIAVANSLLDRQLAAQAAAFEKEGGFTERLYRKRQQNRKSSGQK
jgi:four helix bundle suffix protein